MEKYMKTKLSLAVAAALLAGASSANAGIMIPAGDWTLDIGGIVNTYYTHTSTNGDFEDLLNGAVLGGSNTDDINGNGSSSNITTGLLPNYLSVSGKTRQNDLDVGFTISINPGSSTTRSGIQGSNQENRQAFLTFGDKSWGSIKVGKDLGIFASDAILNDMTLLGVGSGAGILAGNTTTLGRIGTGFMYADWKAQIAYSSPNWNGFSFTGGVTQAWNAIAAAANDANLGTGVNGAFLSATNLSRGGSSPAFEGKVSYEWAGDIGGKVWASAMTQKVENLIGIDALGAAVAAGNDRATGWDIGATVNLAGFGLTGYYGQGDGMGTTIQLRDGFDSSGKARDSDDWYVQATYAIPGVGTKLGASYGESTVEGNGASDLGLGNADYSNEMWTVGAYHPITKHLNLVAEYSNVKTEIGNADGKSKTISLGAIMFF
jgi:predicted porin